MAEYFYKLVVKTWDEFVALRAALEFVYDTKPLNEEQQFGVEILLDRTNLRFEREMGRLYTREYVQKQARTKVRPPVEVQTRVRTEAEKHMEETIAALKAGIPLPAESKPDIDGNDTQNRDTD